jgi:chromosome segregation ATPase
MRLTTLLRLAVLASLFAILGISCPAQDQNTDDVAAAARKAREQQKAAAKPKKVVTNDDMPSAPASTAPASDATAAKSEGQQATSTGSATDEKAAENDPKSEAYWHKRFQELRDKLAHAQKELDLLQRELDKDQVQYYSDPQKALMQQHDRSDINDKTAKIDAKKKEIDSINQQISDLEDELRKAGGDPGWAR